MRSSSRRIRPTAATPALAAAVVFAVAVIAGAPEPGNAPAQDDGVRTWGALHAMHHEGKTAAVVDLDELLPDPRLYAVGAVAGLAGEITVVGGVAHVAATTGADEATTTSLTDGSVPAALLVASSVEGWHAVETQHAIAFADLDAAVADLARQAGIPEGRRFVFVVEGDVEDLRWHVVDGSRIRPGGAMHEQHLAASVQRQRDRVAATLVGFYSTTDQGVFTHMGSRTHVHCVVAEPLASGHVDAVVIPAGTTVKLSVR